MKENNEEDSSHSSSKKLIDVTKMKTVKSEIFIELEDKNRPFEEDSSLRRESQTSFTKALLNKVQKEEEEVFMKNLMKETQKLKSQIKSLLRKDYIVFFLILYSCGLNFNFLFLPFVSVSMIYYPAIELLSPKLMKLKYFLEIFTVGYASYLFLYKVIIYSLIKNENQSVTKDYKNYYIDLGICTLRDKDSYYYFFLNFLPELIIIAASAYGILTSFRCRLLKKTDTLSKNITSVQLTKIILIIYLFFVAFTYFHFSYLSLFYMICIQFVMLLNSLKINYKVIKKILKFLLHFLNLIICLQIILMNYLNIFTIQKSAQDYYNNNTNRNGFAKYFTWKQIGINIDKSKKFEDEFIKLGGYFFAIIILMLSKSTINNLNSELNLEPNININFTNKIKKDSSAFKKLKNILSIILTKIMLFLSHPTFNFETTRVLSITWTYYYINIYSLGILIFVFLSFFSVHIKKNKCLVIYILNPMLFLSLCSFHISNINGLFEYFSDDVDENDKVTMKYMRLGVGKYEFPLLEYWIGHLFYVIVMFLINSICTAELKPKNIGSIKRIEINEENKDEKKVEEQLEKEDKDDENQENEEDIKNNKNNNEDEKKEFTIDTQHSINDHDNNSMLLKNIEDDESQKKKKKNGENGKKYHY